MNKASRPAGRLILLATVLLLVAACNRNVPSETEAAACEAWRHWQAYADHYIQQDGRVIEHSAAGRTTSEGQAYALFFALVANDRPRFEAILAWTENNLAAGDLSGRLPAWLWGQREDGSWGVIDANAASDADAWLAYSLIQAGSVWSEPRYSDLGRLLLAQIRIHEVEQVPGVGPVLLPGPQGFKLADDARRLNPSYLAIQQFRAFAAVDPKGPWDGLAHTSARLLQAAATGGLVPDWFLLKDGGEVSADPVKGDVGSYDAIRVYLWAGMLSRQDALSDDLLSRLGGMRDALRTHVAPPLEVGVASGRVTGVGPAGFSAALLPYLERLAERELSDTQQRRVASKVDDHLLGTPPLYYDQNLALFARWWMTGRYAFDASGRLVLDEERKCLSKES